MPYFVLVLDPNEQFGRDLGTSLKAEFEILTCTLSHQALEQLRSTRPPDLIVVDYDLPDMPGLTFLRVIRDMELGKNLPVVLMSARKTEEIVVQAYGLGVDDYLQKPFDNREMQVRIRAVLRRKYERLEHWGHALSMAGLEIDPSQRRCVVFGRRVTLQPREFELLEILMRKAGRVLTRVYLLESVWGMSTKAETRAVDVMVSRLRKRLGARAARLIETVSKLGYSFRDPGAA